MYDTDEKLLKKINFGLGDDQKKVEHTQKIILSKTLDEILPKLDWYQSPNNCEHLKELVPELEEDEINRFIKKVYSILPIQFWN